MARVLASEVKEIITTSKSAGDLDPYINTANSMVTTQLGSEDLTVSQLKYIELWLSAHFIAIDEPQPTKEKIGDAEVEYERGNQSGKGIGETRFGRQAIALDPTGKLANIGKKKVSFTAIDLGLDD